MTKPKVHQAPTCHLMLGPIIREIPKHHWMPNLLIWTVIFVITTWQHWRQLSINKMPLSFLIVHVQINLVSNTRKYKNCDFWGEENICISTPLKASLKIFGTYLNELTEGETCVADTDDAFQKFRMSQHAVLQAVIQEIFVVSEHIIDVLRFCQLL